MKVNKIELDYLRFTSWEWRVKDNWEKMVKRIVGETDVHASGSRFLQYKGLSWAMGSGSVFIGSAVQKREGRRDLHYIVNITGVVAEEWFRVHSKKERGLNMGVCKRMDVQVTVKRRTVNEIRGIKDKLEGAWESMGQRGRVTEMIENRRTGSTLYIGARKDSEQMWRLYEKTGVHGLFLRFEVEMKKKRAAVAYEAIYGGHRSIVELFAGEFNALPSLADTVNEWRDARLLAGGSQRLVVSTETVQTDHVRWLREVVIPSIKKSANDHEVGAVVREMVRDLYLDIGDAL